RDRPAPAARGGVDEPGGAGGDLPRLALPRRAPAGHRVARRAQQDRWLMGRGAWHTPGHRVLRAAAALVAALAMLASCSSATEDEARPGTPDASVPASLDGVGEVRVVQITRVPEMATDLALVDGRLFVTGRSGRVFEVRTDDDGGEGGATIRTALDLRDETSTDGEPTAGRVT